MFDTIITGDFQKLMASVKRQRLSDGSKTPSTCCLKETHVKSEETCRQKGNGCKKIYYINSNQKKAVVAISILERGESQLQGKERYQGKQYITQCQRSKFSKKT